MNWADIVLQMEKILHVLIIIVTQTECCSFISLLVSVCSVYIRFFVPGS